MEKIVVIPAYKPNKELIALVDELSSHNLGIVVVNDGSGAEYNEIFDDNSSSTCNVILLSIMIFCIIRDKKNILNYYLLCSLFYVIPIHVLPIQSAI